MIRPPNRRVLVAVLAVSLALPLVPLADDTAHAAEPYTCTDMHEHPLWIRTVDVFETGGDADDETYFPTEGAAFVESGTQLVFELDIHNRFDDDACVGFTGELTNDLMIRMEYHDIDGQDGPAVVQTDVSCQNDEETDSSTSVQPGQNCIQRIRLPTSVNEEVQAPSTASPEQRIRFVVFDQDANWESTQGELTDCAWQDEDPTDDDPQQGACTGAERVIVTDQLPDLEVTSLDWPTPLYTTTQRTFTAIDVVVENTGGYANWNPNGARGDGEFWERSSFDGDANGDPEETGQGTHHFRQHVGPDCKQTVTDWPVDGMRCSYRRGSVIQVPLFHEILRNGEESVETGVTDLHSPDFVDAPEKDKGDIALLPGATMNKQLQEALDRYKRAGDFDVFVHVDRDRATFEDDEIFNVPESDEDNNDDDDTVDIKGVDLAISQPSVVVQLPDGGTQSDACLSETNPCPLEKNGQKSKILVDTRVKNTGDNVDDANKSDLRKSEWRASVYLGDEQEMERLNGEPGEEDLDRKFGEVPHTNDGDVRLYEGDPREILPREGGGNHTVQVRLDDLANYQSDWDDEVTDEVGIIGERNERNQCQTTGQDPDNYYCITFWFVDTQAPVIQESRVITQDADGGETVTTDEDDTVPEIQEGSNVTFEADVEDSSLRNVTAVLEHANGTPAEFTGPDGETFTNLSMEETGDGNTWNVTTKLHGDVDVDDYVYKVQAEDLNHTETATFGEFDLTGLPTQVLVDPPDGGGFTVNDETSFNTDPPRYQGTADVSENEFNITASINGTGHATSADVANNTSVEVVRPNGDTAAWAGVETTIRCSINDAVTENHDGFRTGDDCRNDEEEPEYNVDQIWDWYYLNSTHEAVTNGGIDLDWVGWFDVVFHVSDRFGRNTTFDRSGRIADKLNDNGEENPILENANVTPEAVDPGDTVQAEGDAFDALRVENVTLNITKPSGDLVQAELKVTPDGLEDQKTMNGSYANTFDVGPQAPFFDQGGSYQVHVAAEDFAGNVAEADEVSLAVNDTDHPTIAEFRTVPNGTQEVGGPVTWVAEVDDQTAVKPPELRIERPESGLVRDANGDIPEMTYNETEDRWKYGPIEATDVDVGTWTYDLSVEDYTGKQSTASGEIGVQQNLAPQFINWTPSVSGAADGIYGPPQPTISVEVVDYGQGVDPDSINFTLEGEEVDYGRTATDTCTQCYLLAYTPEEAFEAGSTVDVTVQANDTSEPPQESDTVVHQFEVDASAPTADLQMGPAVTSGERRVIGIPTDIDVSVTDGGSGPGSTDVTVTSADADGASQTITLAGGEGTFRLQELEEVVDGHGTYQISVEATDAVGNTADPVQQPVLFDKLGPSIDVFPEPGKPREIVFANVTDDADIQKVQAHYSVDDGPEQTLALEENAGTWTVRLYNQRTDQAFQEGSTVRFTVEATDIFGNVRSSSERNFTAGDSVPTVEFTTPEEGATISDTTEIVWSADDAETPNDELRISLFYKKPGSTFQEIPDAQDIPNQGSYRLDTTGLPNGEVTLQVFVLDGQNFAADEVNVTVRNLGETFSSPQIEDAANEDGRDVVAPNQETTFRVQIDGNVRTARAEITRNGSVVQTIELQNTAGSTWEGTFTAPAERGEYAVDLLAETDEGVEEASSAYAFSVQGEPEGDNFIPEWTLLTALTATAVALGALGLKSRWT